MKIKWRADLRSLYSVLFFGFIRVTLSFGIPVTPSLFAERKAMVAIILKIFLISFVCFKTFQRINKSCDLRNSLKFQRKQPTSRVDLPTLGNLVAVTVNKQRLSLDCLNEAPPSQFLLPPCTPRMSAGEETPVERKKENRRRYANRAAEFAVAQERRTEKGIGEKNERASRPQRADAGSTGSPLQQNESFMPLFYAVLEHKLLSLSLPVSFREWTRRRMIKNSRVLAFRARWHGRFDCRCATRI